MVLVVAQIRTVRQCWIEKRDDARMVHRDLNSQLCEILKRCGSHFHETLKRGCSHFHTRIFTRYLRRRGLCVHGLLSQQSSWRSAHFIISIWAWFSRRGPVLLVRKKKTAVPSSARRWLGDASSKDWAHMVLHLPHAEGGFGCS